MYNYVVYDTPEYKKACLDNPKVRMVGYGADEDFEFRTKIDSFDQLLNDKYDDIVKMEFGTHHDDDDDENDKNFETIGIVVGKCFDMGQMKKFPSRIEQFRCFNCNIIGYFKFYIIVHMMKNKLTLMFFTRTIKILKHIHPQWTPVISQSIIIHITSIRINIDISITS